LPPIHIDGGGRHLLADATGNSCVNNRQLFILTRPLSVCPSHLYLLLLLVVLLLRHTLSAYTLSFQRASVASGDVKHRSVIDVLTDFMSLIGNEHCAQEARQSSASVPPTTIDSSLIGRLLRANRATAH